MCVRALLLGGLCDCWISFGFNLIYFGLLEADVLRGPATLHILFPSTSGQTPWSIHSGWPYSLHIIFRLNSRSHRAPHMNNQRW